MMDGTAGGSVDWVAHIPVILAVLGFGAGIAAALIKVMTREEFMNRKEIAERFAATQHLFAQNSARMDDVHDRTTRLEESDKYQVQRLAESLEQLSRQMRSISESTARQNEAITRRIEKLTDQQERQTTVLAALEERVESVRRER